MRLPRCRPSSRRECLRIWYSSLPVPSPLSDICSVTVRLHDALTGNPLGDTTAPVWTPTLENIKREEEQLSKRNGNFALLLRPTSGAKMKVFENKFWVSKKLEIAIFLIFFKRTTPVEETFGTVIPNPSLCVGV